MVLDKKILEVITQFKNWFNITIINEEDINLKNLNSLEEEYKYYIEALKKVYSVNFENPTEKDKAIIFIMTSYQKLFLICEEIKSDSELKKYLEQVFDTIEFLLR